MNKQEYEVDEDANQRDWQMVSRIVDRICMIIFFIISIVLVAGYIIDLSIRIKLTCQMTMILNSFENNMLFI